MVSNAKDALTGWLAHAKPKFIKSPSKYDQLSYLSGEIVPVSVNENIIDSYQEVK